MQKEISRLASGGGRITKQAYSLDPARHRTARKANRTIVVGVTWFDTLDRPSKRTHLNLVTPKPTHSGATLALREVGRCW
jgi:hypothetical protein